MCFVPEKLRDNNIYGKKLKNWKSIISNISNSSGYNHALAFFAFILPVSEKFSTYTIGLSLLILFGDFFTGKNKFKVHKELLPLVFLYLTYVVVSIYMSGEIQFKWLENKASLLIFPVLFFTSHEINKKRIFSFFVYGCLTAYLICLFLAVNNSISLSDGSFSFNPLINSNRGFFESMVYEGNYFFGVHFTIMQISYFATYLALSLAMLLFYFKEFKGRQVVISVLILAIIQTISLAGLINLCIVFSLYILYYIKSTKVRTFTTLGLLATILLGGIYHPRISNTLKGFYKTVNNENSARYPKQPRLITWEASLGAIEESGFFGVGIGNSQRILNREYEKIGFLKGKNENLNAHNQYFQILIECGALGLFILLLILYLIINKTIKYKAREKIVIVSFFWILLISFAFESMLSRYVGISFFSFFTCLLLRINEGLD